MISTETSTADRPTAVGSRTTGVVASGSLSPASAPSIDPKAERARYIPLSDFAVDVLGMATKAADDPHVFIRLETSNPYKTYGAFREGARGDRAGLGASGGFPTLSSNTVVRLGVDLKTIQRLLGHQDIRTTMREAMSLRQLVIGFQTGPGGLGVGAPSIHSKLLKSEE
jgi:integrase